MTAPSLPRLTRVELRKMTDTRAGFWLLVATALAAVIPVVITITAGSELDQNLDRLFRLCGIAVSFLLPIVGLLAVTGEWSQRTTLTTFTLVPRRERVIAAKLLAGSLLALASVVACLLVAGAGTLVVGGPWNLSLSRLAGGVVYMQIVMLAGLSLGLLLMRSAPAIVAYFVVPTVIGVLIQMVDSLRGPAEWFELGSATQPVADGAMAAGDWPRLAVGLAIWIGLPLVVGRLRLRRSELA